MKNKKGLKALLLIPIISMTVSACTFSLEEPSQELSGGVVEPGYETEHFRVTYYNYDDSFLWSTYVQNNTKSEYKGPNPTKPSDDEHDYIFEGWYAIDGIEYGRLVTKDCSYRATYTSKPVERYACYFYNYDGSPLYDTVVKAGESAIYLGQTPTRPDEGDIKYTFIGWDKSTRDIRAQTSFIAMYSSVNPTFVVRFYNYDGTLLDIKQVPYGDTVTYDGPTPSKPSQDDKSFRFVRWDKPLENITADTDIHAEFESDSRLVNIRYLNADGTVLQTKNIPYGEVPTYTGRTPTKESEGRIGYVFDKWSIENEPAYINTDIVAIFKEVERNLTTGLSFTYNEGTATYEVAGYNGSANEVYIPTIYNGNKGEHSVTSIGVEAFLNSNVTHLIIGENVSEIKDRAFANCARLKIIDFSVNLRKIGANVFEGCSALESLEFPKYVNDVVRETFSGFNLDILRISEDNKFYAIVDGFLMNGACTTIYFPVGENYYNELIVPDGVKIIAARAFKFGRINKVVFPSSLERIGTEAFAYINNLKEVVFLDSEAVLETSCFQGCNALQTIDMGSKIETVKARAFSGANISSLTISKECTAFDLTALESCSILAEVSVEEGNSKFSSYDGALYQKGFTSLIYLPPAKRGTLKLNKALKNLSDDTFKNCSIESFEVDEDSEFFSSYKGVVYSKDLTELVLAPSLLSTFEAPSTLTSITGGAFSNCDEILTIDISNTAIKEVGENAFANCSNLRTVVLPDGVEKIGVHSFRNCSSLSSINLGSNINRICEGAFENCRALSTLNIPNATERIDDNAFSNTGISTLNLGSGLIHIGEFAFSKCNNLGSVIIPNNVSSIGKSAFVSCTKLTSITVGSGCNSIGEYCFAGCTSLTSATIASTTISSAGSNIFDSDTKLKDVDLGSGFDSIPDSMFKGCTALKAISIPNSVETIGESAFEDCSLLDTINVGTSLQTISSKSFKNCISLVDVSFGDNLSAFSSDSFEGCTNIKTFDLGNSIKSIPSNAFSSMSGLETIVIPDSVTTFGENVFNNNKGIKTVEIGKSLAAIPNYTFNGCNNLTNIDLSSASSLTSIGEYAFAECKNLSSITVPNTVTTIGTYAFYNCSNLKTAVLSENITTLPDNLFGNCAKLESFKVPDNVTNLSRNSFRNCSGMKTFNFGEGVTNIDSDCLSYFNSLEEVVLPSTIQYLPQYLFESRTTLKNVTLPESLLEIPYGLFNGCTSLESIVIPNSVTRIGGYAFSNCSSLTDVTIGTSVNYLEYAVFRNCTSLETIDIPSNVTGWSSEVFSGCSSLKSVSLPNNFNTIQSYSFRGCSSLESISLPTNCQYVYSYAFDDCTSLTTVTNMSNIRYIYDYAFRNCTNLVNIELSSNLSRISNGAFNGCDSLSYNIYQNGKYLKVGSNEHGVLVSIVDKSVTSFTFAEDVKFISGQLFSETQITSVTIPAGMEELPDYMFSGMTQLEEIAIPNTVRSIGNYAFNNCTNLTTVTLPNTITRIGDYAFYYCSSLESIYIPDSIITIGNYAFYYCSSLTSVRLSKNLENLYAGAFCYCSSLEEISLPDKVRYIGSDCFSYTLISEIRIPKATNSIDCPFRNMSYLKTLTIDSENKNFTLINGSLYSYDKKTLYYYCFKDNEQYVIIPKTVTYLYTYCFDYNAEFYDIYFEGSEAECDITFGWGWMDSRYFDSANWHYYSSIYQVGAWHYVNNVPTLYE